MDRSWFYTLAACTGLRRLELQSLQPESFDLDPIDPNVTLPPHRTKNRKVAVQPLPGYILEDLRSWLATKTAGKVLFPRTTTTATMIRVDLRAAGIQPDGFCFHSLRHTFVSRVVESGASVKVCMELAPTPRPT